MLTPVHVHSNYSLLEGTIDISSLIEKAKSFGLTSISLADTNGMYGLIEFFKKAAEANLKPILGTFIDDENDKETYAVFLAKNLEGYGDICKIITTKKLKEDFSLTNLLQTYFPNLFIITNSLKLLKNIPRHNNIFAELISTKAKRSRTKVLYNYAVQNNIPFVASNPIYFLDEKDFLIHKVVTAIKNRETISNLDEENLVDKEFYFKDPKKTFKLWSSIPDAIKNLNYIIENCNVDLQLGKLKFPLFQSSSYENSILLLKNLSFDGLKKRYDIITKKIEDRLNEELGVINDMGFADYFLVVWDISKEAKRRGMMTIGRGSAANSIVSYCLGFTEVDPIKYNFYFQRFLNKSRTSPPDIDIDFSWRERDGIIKYVFEKYGYDKVAMISTHVTFKARSAFRETAKTFGKSDSEISKLSKFIPWTDARNLPNVAQLFPEAKSLKLNEEPWSSIVKIASRLANFPRHLSIHPGGIVISPTHITNYTALEYAKNKGLGIIVTQPDMHGIEDLGLIKIDLLSQRSLGVLRDTIKQIGNESVN